MAPSSSFQNKLSGALNFLHKNNGSSLAEIEKYFGVKFGSLMTKSQLRLAVVRALKNDIKNGTIVEKNKRFFLADPGIECPCMNIRSTDDMTSSCCPMKRRRSGCNKRRRRRLSRCRRIRRSRCKRRRRRSACKRRRRRSASKRRRRRSACKRRRRRSSKCRGRSKSIYPEDVPSNRTHTSLHSRPVGDTKSRATVLILNKTFHADYDTKTPEDSANHSDQ